MNATQNATQVICVRHAESDDNAAGICGGSRESELTDRGYDQARELAHRLRGHGVCRVYTSSMSRAVQTGHVIIKELDVPISVVPYLCERFVGHAFQGRPNEEIDRDVADEREHMFSLSRRDMFMYRYRAAQDAETALQAVAPLDGFCSYACIAHPGERIVLVGHAAAFGAFGAWHHFWDPAGTFLADGISNTMMFTVEVSQPVVSPTRGPDL